MTEKTTTRSQAAGTNKDAVPVPENPTHAELKSSLEKAEFPRASQMSKEIFGESPVHTDEEE